MAEACKKSQSNDFGRLGIFPAQFLESFVDGE
jgi:hypothetical protein